MPQLHTPEGDLAKCTNGVYHFISPANRSNPITTDTLVSSGKGIYRGYTITASTATANIEIRDATAAGQGTVIDVIPSGTAAGTTKARSTIITTGIYVDYAMLATGTLIVEYL